MPRLRAQLPQSCPRPRRLARAGDPPGIVATALAAAVALCAESSNTCSAGVLESFGLNDREVTSLGVHGALYAGTIGDGVFRTDLANAQPAWMPLGLEGRRIRAVYPHSSGPLGFTTTVGLEGNPVLTDSALVYCAPMDQLPWTVADSGMTRSDIYAVWSLDGFPSPAICGETFAGTLGPAGGVWRRLFESPTWEFVLNLGFAVCNVIRVNLSSGDVWAGGENAVLAPWIARSSDRGDTWQVAYPDLAGDNACNAIAIHPGDPDVAFAGMEGPVIKTTDGGVTWQPTGLATSDAYIYGVALDSSSPSHLIAGGMVRNPNSWALWESFDQGDTWVAVPSPEPGARGISSIVADPLRAGTFYLATFGHGVWRYRSAVTAIDPPPDETTRAGLAFGRVYPNPFRTGTTFELVIPATLARSPALLTIHTARGALVRTLVDGIQGSGTHRIAWNGEDEHGRRVVPGVYYGRLRVGIEQVSRSVAVVQ